MDSKQHSTAHRKLTLGIFSGVSTLLFIGILIVIQLISEKHNVRIDLTSNQRHSLSEQTVKVLNHLDEPIVAHCFYNEDQPEYETAKDLLQQYHHTAPERFEFRFHNLDKSPVLANKFTVIAYATTVFEMGDDFRKASVADEKEFTSTIVKLTRGDQKKKVVFVTMHGERDTESMEALGISHLKLALEDENYLVESVNLAREPAVPPDTAILVIAGPGSDFLDPEISAIRNYIQSGGNLLVLIDPQTAPKLAAMLAEYGVLLGDDVIIDPSGFQHPLRPIIEDYPEHEITHNFSMGTIYFAVRSVRAADTPPAGVTLSPLMRTSEESWGETTVNPMENEDVIFNADTDIQGPVPIGQVIEVALPPAGSGEPLSGEPAGAARIIVIGDSDFITNSYVESFASNGALAYNLFHWLSDEKDLIAIPPKDTLSQPMHLSPAQLLAGFWIPVVLIPLLVLSWGGVRIYYRRKQG